MAGGSPEFGPGLFFLAGVAFVSYNVEKLRLSSAWWPMAASCASSSSLAYSGFFMAWICCVFLCVDED